MQIAYANVCCLELSTLNSLKDYLSNRQLRTKVDSKFSLKKKKILHGVLQDSIFGLILFIIFMCDMFLVLHSTYSTGYADARIGENLFMFLC